MTCIISNINFQRHIDEEAYNDLYAKLKTKYGESLIKNWSECTDPYKFVYEDLGIATYLILLWKEAPQTFIDLGCGNGLLVYILTQEGHRGVGIDVRRRKIWDTFPETTILREHTIIPSNDSIYPEADWLIGNHSDELTAWLPIMAARSSATCQFFTIPCCPFKLNGAKFQRRNTSRSIYQDFLKYVQEVGETCGFEMTAEKLRIPSTKRICLIGRRKETMLPDDAISSFIEKECPGGVGSGASMDRWITEFKPRIAVEPVRNCTKVAKNVQKSILLATQAVLLSFSRLCPIELDRVWNRGGQVKISDIANALDDELLHKLRAECKGLQTLLKNHHQVFLIQFGLVELRSPEELRSKSDEVRQRKDFKWKQKHCWFHDNHPDGCPLRDAHCSYLHFNSLH